MKSRVREELARARRYGREFALITLEAKPSNDGVPVRKRIEQALEVLEPRLRPSDVVGRAFEDTVVLLLVETGARGAKDALVRIRARLIGMGAWEVGMLAFPGDEAEIEGLQMLSAA
jgi:hypothetical protein